MICCNLPIVGNFLQAIENISLFDDWNCFSVVLVDGAYEDSENDISTTLTVQGIEYIDSEFRECLTKCTQVTNQTPYTKKVAILIFFELVKKNVCSAKDSIILKESKNNKDKTRSLSVLFVIVSQKIVDLNVEIGVVTKKINEQACFACGERRKQFL